VAGLLRLCPERPSEAIHGAVKGVRIPRYVFPRRRQDGRQRFLPGSMVRLAEGSTLDKLLREKSAASASLPVACGGPDARQRAAGTRAGPTQAVFSFRATAERAPRTVRPAWPVVSETEKVRPLRRASLPYQQDQPYLAGLRPDRRICKPIASPAHRANPGCPELAAK